MLYFTSYKLTAEEKIHMPKAEKWSVLIEWSLSFLYQSKVKRKDSVFESDKVKKHNHGNNTREITYKTLFESYMVKKT